MNHWMSVNGMVRRVAEEYGRTDLNKTDLDIILWEHTSYPKAAMHVVEQQVHAYFKADA